MLLRFDKFGGYMPRVLDPLALPENRSQQALYCRFDRGGLMPLRENVLYETPTKAGDKMSLFMYYNGGVKYPFSWLTDVNAVRAPLANDAYNRIYYTEEGNFRVTDSTLFNQGGTDYPMAYYNPSPPAPATALTATPVVSGSDPTLLETRGYVYTYVNGYGQEGPPSPVSNLFDCYDGNTVNLSAMATSPGATYNITKKRIYRLNQTVSGDTQYQYLTEIAIATTTYADTTVNTSLGEVLATDEWDGPPSGLTGLIALPNGVMAGFVDNLVCFSVPYYPHAWPASYQKAIDRDVVALGAFGTTVVVLTGGDPYLIVGNDPANSVMEKMDGMPCSAKRGVVQLVINGSEAVVYPCPHGLYAIGSNIKGLITEDVISFDHWKNVYQPSTFYAYTWQNKYFGFYTPYNRPGLGVKALMIFDPQTKDLVDANYYATAGYMDPNDGVLYLTGGNVGDGTTKIYTVNDGYSGDVFDLTYLTPRRRYAPASLQVIKAIATQYPFYVDVIYPAIPHTEMREITSRNAHRIKPYLTDECEVRIRNVPGQLTAVYLSDTMEELPV